MTLLQCMRKTHGNKTRCEAKCVSCICLLLLTCGSLALLSVMSPSPVSLLGTLLGPQGRPRQARFSGARPHVRHDSLQRLLLGCCCSPEVAGGIGVQHCALILSRVSLMCQRCSTHIQSVLYTCLYMSHLVQNYLGRIVLMCQCCSAHTHNING